MNNELFPGVAVNEDGMMTRPASSVDDPPRLRRPDRDQALLQPCVLEDLLAEDHPARLVWAVVSKWDLSRFYATIVARGENPGRSATDPKLLIALWLYAYTRGVGNGRELARLCLEHDAYRWLCGGVSVNYHTLNDFRVGFEKELDDLLTQMIGTLISKDLVSVERISQDGTRIRAGAGRRSFKKRLTLEDHLKSAREQVEAMKKEQDDPNASLRQQAARKRAAREREQRLEEALKELEQVEAAKAKQKDKPSRENPARASETDPEARMMKLPQGGTGPGYDVQYATAVEGRVIVGVGVSNAGSDAGKDEAMREQVGSRTQEPIKEQLIDGGYVDLKQIDQAARERVTLYMPLPKPRKEGVDPHQPKRTDSEAVADWRVRMGTQEAKEIYKQRASTSETVNGETRTYRGLSQVLVRGVRKVRCVALWSALAYNLVHCGRALAG